MAAIDIVAADAQAVNGLLYSGDKARRDAANDDFRGIDKPRRIVSRSFDSCG
jgi:hypothetical protein